MNNDQICWEDNRLFHEEMVKSVKSHKPLDQVPHGQVLIKLLEDIDKEGVEVLDLGCGGSFVSTIIKGEYTGGDQEHIIENVSKKCFSSLNYIDCDLIYDDLRFISEFDIVILNAVIDVMSSPLEVLENVLKHSKKYVIIHRQGMTYQNLENGFNLYEQPSYGGKTFQTCLNIDKFNDALYNNGFKIIKELDSGLGLPMSRSFLLKKNN